jgi:hypothetical protein
MISAAIKEVVTYPLVIEMGHLLPEGKVFHQSRPAAASPQTPLLRKGPTDVGRHVVVLADKDVGVLEKGAGRPIGRGVSGAEAGGEEPRALGHRERGQGSDWQCEEGEGDDVDHVGRECLARRGFQRWSRVAVSYATGTWQLRRLDLLCLCLCK